MWAWIKVLFSNSQNRERQKYYWNVILSIKSEQFTTLKHIYLKKKNPNVFDTTGHHKVKKIPSTKCIFHILR